MVLQVFVGNDAGRVKPHGFYQACRVTGRNTTACKEVDIDGTTVIEVTLDPSNKMTLAYVHFFSHLNVLGFLFGDKYYSNQDLIFACLRTKGSFENKHSFVFSCTSDSSNKLFRKAIA